jgi:predicted nucleic acid-binding protein
MEFFDIPNREYTLQKIQPIGNFPPMKHFLQEIGIPEHILTDLFLFSLPEKKLSLYYVHYKLIFTENPYHPIPFSFQDFLLAYVAAENQYEIVSYDHHLLNRINAYLDYDAFWPQDIRCFPGDSIVLLDANILLRFLEIGSPKLEIIEEMFRRSPSITFLLPEFIFSEIVQVYYKKYAAIDQQHEISRPLSNLSRNCPSEDSLHQFIDDFSRFESGKQRKKRKAKARSKRRSTSTGVITKRYRRLYQDLSL